MNKKYVLKSNQDISKLVGERKSVGNKYFVIYYKKIDSTKPKIAISISKHLGGAVERNHEKRVAREIIRKSCLFDLFHLEALFVLKGPSIELSYEEKEKQIVELVRKVKEKTK